MKKTMLIMALLMAAILPSTCSAASHGGQRTSRATTNRSQSSYGSGRASSARQSTGYTSRASSSNRQSSYRPSSSSARYQTGNYQTSGHGNYQPQANNRRSGHSSGSNSLLALTAGIVLGSTLNSQPCESTYVAPPVVCETPAPRVVYVQAPRSQTVIYVPSQPVCNAPSVMMQQTVINDPPSVSEPIEPACAITGHVRLVGFCKPTSICIPAVKPVSVGTEIWFMSAGELVGKFCVTGFNIDCGTVTTKLLCGSEPANGTDFAIVYPS